MSGVIRILTAEEVKRVQSYLNLSAAAKVGGAEYARGLYFGIAYGLVEGTNYDVTESGKLIKRCGMEAV